MLLHHASEVSNFQKLIIMPEFDDFSYEGGGYGDTGDYYDDFDIGDDYYYDDYEDDYSDYDDYSFDNPDWFHSYDYDDYYGGDVYDEDAGYESDGKGGWNFSLGGVPDTLKDFATGVAGNHAQQSIGYKYWKKRTDYEDALRSKWFDIENAHNSPLAFMNRLNAAGLNGAMIMSGSSGGAAVGASTGRRSTAGGSAPVLGSPITSPSKLAELNVMDSVANKNNAEANKAQSDVEHNSYMNRLAEAQAGVQRSLIGVNNAEAEGKRLNNALTRLNYDAMSSSFDVLTGVDSNGKTSYTKMNAAMANAVNTVLSVSAKNMESLVKQGTAREYWQSVIDQFATAGEVYRASKSDADLKNLQFQIADANRWSSEWGSAFRSFGGPEIVGRIVSGLFSAFTGNKTQAATEIIETIFDKTGEAVGGKTIEKRIVN